MDEKKSGGNANAIEGLGTSVSKAINAFRVQKELKLWIILGLVGAVGVYFLVKLIKKSALNEIPLPELPNDGNQIADVETFKQQSEILAKEVKDVTEGWFTLAGTKEGVFRRLYALADSELIYTYRVYNTFYFTKNQETMTAAIDGETNYIPEWEGGVKAKLVNRLILLGAK